MAAAYIPFDRNKDVTRKVVGALQKLREGKQDLEDALEVMTQMKDGDGSQAAHFDLLASQGTFAAGDYADANAAAKAFFDEVSSLSFKLNTNGSITDMDAALIQACAKLGV
jgi:hypothetical protein